ncbi:MAG: hypothetical protein ACRDQW_17725, partial [Haloechinothrix sp.]
VDKGGRVTLRYDSRLHHIGLGRAHSGKRVLILVADLEIRVITEEGELLRNLTWTRPGTTSRWDEVEGCPETSVHDVPRHHT